MEGLTDILKKTIVVLGVVVLSYGPLNAQKGETDRIEGGNMDYCISKRSIKSNSGYLKRKQKKENYCFSKAAERHDNKYSKREENEVPCIYDKEKIFHKQYKKMVRDRLQKYTK
jgi:hypothetical protein